MAAAVPITDVTIVADLAFFWTHDPIATATDENTCVLLCGTHLSWLATPSGCFAAAQRRPAVGEA